LLNKRNKIFNVGCYVINRDHSCLVYKEDDYVCDYNKKLRLCNLKMRIFRFNAHLVFLLARDIRETLASVHSYLKDTVIDAEVLSVATT
jgi:hypothetical protein